MLDTFHLSQFTESLNTQFRVTLASDRSADLELVMAEDLGSTPRQERFHILLRGPLDAFVPQGMYDVAHARLGAFPLFLVPVAREAGGFVYEAVFNRVTEP